MTSDDLVHTDQIRRAIEPWHVASVATQRRQFNADTAATSARMCAVVDGDVVGFGTATLSAPSSSAIVSVRVRPYTRGGGIGTALYQRVEAHLCTVGADQAQTFVMDDPDSRNFAVRHGFTLGATDRFVVVDPRILPPAPPAAADVTVLTAGEAGPEPFHAVSDTAARDEPGDVVFEGIPYESWLTRYWPTVDQNVSMIAFVGGVPAATTALDTNYATGRAMSIGSDALREFRGRGLIKLIKSRSLRAAAERGITASFTANDEDNAPIRAINAWLGYTDVGAVRSAVKALPGRRGITEP